MGYTQGMHGSFQTIDDRPAVQFERRLSHPIEAVWRAVTEPAELAHWFPGRVEIDGSRLRFEDAGTTFAEKGEMALARRVIQFGLRIVF